MTRSEIRKYYPEEALQVVDWDEIGDYNGYQGASKYSLDIAARKEITGQAYWEGGNLQDEAMPLEANKEVTVTESWLRVDRDGDGIAEL